MASSSSDHIKITIDDQSLDINAPAPEPLVSTASMEKTEICQASDQPQIMALDAVNNTVDKSNFENDSTASGSLTKEGHMAPDEPLKVVIDVDSTASRPLIRKIRMAPKEPFKEEIDFDSTASRPPRIERRMTLDEPFKKSNVDNAKSGIIYKVPVRLRAENWKAYIPIVISIGPYHYGAARLMTMEVIKKSCFDKIVEETKLDFSEFLQVMTPFAEKVLKCYEKPFKPYFVQNMVYDACFIVQLVRRIYPEEDFFKLESTQTAIRYDLLLLENQLPFFVLLELYSMIVPSGDLDEFARSALSLFRKKRQGAEIWPCSKRKNFPFPNKDIKDIKHLLDLVHSCCHPSQYHQDLKAKAATKVEAKQRKDQHSWKSIRSATELADAGISFFGEKVQDQDQDQVVASLFDIKFTEDTKVLKIPTLKVDDNTERILRNFMAYEQFIPSGKPTYVSDYVVFMDNLINTGKDVQLLCNRGVIDNWLGDDEVVAQMFNKLRDFIYSSEDFYYAEIFDMVNEHCQEKWSKWKEKWNKWKATLNRDYFSSPWSLMSVLAAVFLLLLTLLQTIFSALSYFQWYV